jgi:hypothetical protein
LGLSTAIQITDRVSARQQQPEPLEFQKLPFHPGIGLSVSLPRAVRRLLVAFVDLFTQCV